MHYEKLLSVVFAVAFVASLIAEPAFGHEEHKDHKPPTDKQPDHTKPKDTAFGRAADAALAKRTILVQMHDSYQFSPREITVQAGEVVRFVVVNAGESVHEMVLGTMKDLEEHNELMRKHPGMHHDDAHMAHVAPGKSGVIVWQFTTPGEFYFGCLVDDHFEMGMVGKIQVAGEPSRHSAHDSMQHAPAAEMPAAFGRYPMTRESSGTSWQPDASPHEGIHRTLGDWMTMTHGFAQFVYDRQGGPRGDKKTFANSMLMVMGQRSLGEGNTLGLRAMLSADPLFGKGGYPLLLQTGETADGRTPLIDRQHPHDLFMELAASYSRRLSDNSSVFGYFGLPGEPALGPPAFMHRFSGEDNPEAPISHHWLDSTHIAFGVVTLGYVYGDMKLEGSAFRGREPDESRYNIETGKLDSSSIRFSYNPTRNWSLQASRGHIKSPEQLHPDDDVDRTTASAIYHRDLRSAKWQTMLAWGRNKPGHGDATNAYLLESAISLSATHTLFGRVERAEKNELFLDDSPLAHTTFRVSKLSVGYIYDLPRQDHFKLGFGGLVSRYDLPGELKPVYGNPTSFMLFARVKFM
jgi:uncharacterized cupredoxin-like copper-binding protein